VPFHNAGIPAALFIHLDYRKAANGQCATGTGSNCTGCSYTTEPAYHTSRDAMDNVSQFYLQEQLDVIGASYIWNALNKVDVNVTDGPGAPVPNAMVTGNCGDGVREFGTTDANGYIEIRVPHVTCDFRVKNGNAVGSANGFAVAGDKALAIKLTSADGSAGGSVPATLSLTLGSPPATFPTFVPGVTRPYEASTTANIISTAGDATLSVADPSAFQTGHLVNGTFFLPQPLQARARNAGTPPPPAPAYNNVGSSASPLNLLTYSGPVSNDQVALQFSQLINATDALRTGTYSKTLTFTLSTTTP
jgi:hypothetical protein